MKTPSPAPDLVEEPEAAPPADGMADTHEIELKFLLDEAAFKAAQQHPLLGGPARRRARRLHSVYFDTEDGALWHSRTVLRVRTQRGAHQMALKAEGADSSNPFLRREIQARCPTAEPDIALLGPDVAAELERATEGRPLLARFTTDIRRDARIVPAGAGSVEVAFDSGVIATEDAHEAVREIELELASGEPADLFALGLALTEAVPARLGVMTKSARGMRLCGDVAEAVRAESPVAPGQSVDDVIGGIIVACIRQFIGNWPAMESDAAEEAVHQMRVAMRRLRAALALFQRDVPCVEFATMRGQAQRIASAMGEARNWDVFIALVREGPAAAFPTEPGFPALLEACETHRAAGYASVHALLRDPQTTRFVLSALGFVARRGWRNAVAGTDLHQLSEPAAHFAARHLARMHRRMRKRGKRLHDMAAEERHELRIALKRLRYATDFFGCLFPHGSSVRGYTRGAARLQDILGTFNDVAMGSELVHRLDHDNDPHIARAAGITLGWYAHAATDGQSALREAWERFRKAKPFWGGALRDGKE